MVYAYVTSETCKFVRAFLPGDEYMGGPVSTHGDLEPWTLGKRATLAIVAGDFPNTSTGFHRARCAERVADLKGWR